MSPAPSPIALLVMGRMQQVVSPQCKYNHPLILEVPMHYKGAPSCVMVYGDVHLLQCLM